MVKHKVLNKMSKFKSFKFKHHSGRYTCERIDNTKEQISFDERAENHKAKERMFESFK